MALSTLNYFSPALKKATGATILLPEIGDGEPPYPVLYLLHGLSDDHTMWQRRTSIERYVRSLPLLVVMADGGRGFYSDAVEGYAYETAIIEDLIGFVDRTFQTRAERAGRGIAGLSMGGYGAARLALRFPDMFAAAVSHSGATRFGNRTSGHDGSPVPPEFLRILGTDFIGGKNDLYALAKNVPADSLPALRIDCGTEDFLIEDNRHFHAYLTEQKIPHEYAEFPGGHTWEYWDTHIQETIAFMEKHLLGTNQR